jgi:hypothetical protein
MDRGFRRPHFRRGPQNHSGTHDLLWTTNTSVPWIEAYFSASRILAEIGNNRIMCKNNTVPEFLRKVIGSKKRPCCHKQHGHQI